jgi:predicted RNase H-like HicB family nuclease
MRKEFTAILERDGDWHVAYCPEIPGANGQGRTKEEARASLAEAVALILEDRREGRAHSLWSNPATGAVEAIPRQTEIPDGLARRICRNLSVPEIGKPGAAL